MNKIIENKIKEFDKTFLRNTNAKVVDLRNFLKQSLEEVYKQGQIEVLYCHKYLPNREPAKPLKEFLAELRIFPGNDPPSDLITAPGNKGQRRRQGNIGA